MTVSCQKESLNWDLEQLPTVEINAEAISPNKVLISYKIKAESPATTLRVYWNENPDHGPESNFKDIETVGENGNVVIDGLCEETNYYFKAEVKNEIGTNFSSRIEKETLALTGESQPVLAFDADKITIFPGETVNFFNRSSNISCEDDWEWYVDDGLFSNEFNSSFSFTQSGVYSIKLVKKFGGQIKELLRSDYVTVRDIAVNFQTMPEEVLLGDLVQFNAQSEQNITTFEWDFGDGTGTSSLENPEYLYTEVGIYTVSLTACDTYGNCSTHIVENCVSVSLPSYPEGTVLCENASEDIANVVHPWNGRIWMDRNLSASRVATSPTDEDAYGGLYQWGRFSDGHQCRTSPTTILLSHSSSPHHGNFIKAPNAPFDWRSTQDQNLWQGVNGVNNPCPEGYRIPTEAEWNAARIGWNWNNINGAFASFLKLTAGGRRDFNNGDLLLVGSYGYYWSSTVSGSHSKYLNVNASNSTVLINNRAAGLSVRCIKD